MFAHSVTYHYISTGDLGRMYTLRHYQMVCQPYEHPQISDVYECNLSTDLETAVRKARRSVGDKLNLNVPIPALGEIVRSRPRSPEEIEACRIAEEYRAARAHEEVLRAQKELIKRCGAVADLLKLADHPDLNEFLRSLLNQVSRTGDLSDRQIEILPSALIRFHDELQSAPTEPLTEGRRELNGEVLSVRWKDSDWGAALKMVVRLDCGNKIYCTVPAAIDGVEAGEHITFTATVKRSHDDEHFGFASRPSKASIAC